MYKILGQKKDMLTKRIYKHKYYEIKITSNVVFCKTQDNDIHNVRSKQILIKVRNFIELLIILND